MLAQNAALGLHDVADQLFSFHVSALIAVYDREVSHRPERTWSLRSDCSGPCINGSFQQLLRLREVSLVPVDDPETEHDLPSLNSVGGEGAAYAVNILPQNCLVHDSVSGSLVRVGLAQKGHEESLRFPCAIALLPDTTRLDCHGRYES